MDFEWHTKRPERNGPRLGRLALLVGLFSGLALGWLGPVGCASSHKQPDFQLMAQAWNTIEHRYVARNGVQPKELTYGAIEGMVDSLGDTGHSTFLTPQMVKELKNTERGEFKGVGIEIQMKNGHVVVVAPIDDSPAQRAGLQAGDIIVKVNGQEVTDWPIGKVVEHITGPAGTAVKLTLQEPKSARTRQVTLERTSIRLHDVTWAQVPGTSLVHLRLASFGAGVTRDLRKTLAQLRQEDCRGVVLDLRNNPGGLLDEAVGVASQFLQGGNVLLARDAKRKIVPVPVEKGGLATNLAIAVLVNEGSASAAEIVAGALQDSGRAQLVGQTTFGTGTVLQQFNLSDGSALLLAVEEWLTPKGRSFWHKGLTPDFSVPLPPDVSPLLPSAERELAPRDFKATDDRQLLTAVRLLTHEETPRVANEIKR